jgi:hypothetical protein
MLFSLRLALRRDTDGRAAIVSPELRWVNRVGLT